MMEPWLFAVIAGPAVVVGFILGALFVRYRLTGLRQGFHQAHDGILEPVEPPRLCSEFLGQMYREYNQMIVMLSGMFQFVEECQDRFLKERNKMNVIVQSLPAALLSIDDNLHIQTANRQAERLFDTEGAGDGLAGRGVFDMLHLNDGDRELLRDAFLYKQNIRSQVISTMVGDAQRWMTVNLSFITEQEHDMAAVMTLLDITDYKRLQESAYNREKLVAMGQLAAGVAHELNTPLGSIIGYSQLMLDARDDAPAMVSHATVIKEEARRCSHIVHNLLRYARKEHCSGESCEVNGLIEEVVETFVACRLKRDKVEVVLDLHAGELMVEGSCGELDIVLTNLLVNAQQALQGRPEARIRVSTWRRADREICIAVEDNGPGIDPTVRARIFEPFFSTKDVGEGSGLGLSISHAMLSRRGGSIQYDINYAAGARFLLRLPAGTPVAESLSAQHSEQPVAV